MIKTTILVSIYMYIQVATSPMQPIGRLWIKERFAYSLLLLMNRCMYVGILNGGN